MRGSAADCLVLFDTKVTEQLIKGWASGVLLQRVKTIKAGPMTYVECYPIWDTKTARAAKTEAEQERHRKAQAKLNKKNAEKKLTRLLDENFGPRDISITLNYNDGHNPEDSDRMLKDVQNYIDRIKYLRKKRGLPPIRYIYVIEETNGQRGHRLHCHLVMSGDGITLDEAEEKWTGFVAGYTHMGRVRPGRTVEDKNLAALAHYMLDDTKAERTMEADGKNPQRRARRRMWNSSKNLRNPDDYATTADKKISIRKAGRIADMLTDEQGGFAQAKEIFRKLYPDCELAEIEAKRSRWTAGVYIYAELKRKEYYGDKDTGGLSGSERKRGATVPVPLGELPDRQVPGVAAHVSHPKRRKARKSGGDPPQGRRR